MQTITQLPKDKTLDNTIALSREGYLFIKKRTQEHQSDIFETHLFGEKVICMSGEEYAKLFYNAEKFQRNGAAPKRIQKTLFGENAIQTMDGEAHSHRKSVFMSLMTTEHQNELASLVRNKLEASIPRWETSDNVVLFDEAKYILCEAACEWSGVPIGETEIKERANDFNAMVEGFGSVGPRYWIGKGSRERAEAWIKGIIKDVRSGNLKVRENSALHAMAFHKDLEGNELDPHMAAVELINVLRPIVAISTYITFAALALHDYIECRECLQSGDEDYLQMFTQEVRRYYPFTPFVGARVKKDFIWNEYEFKQGNLVLLDIYGNNHDHRIWNSPNKFNPNRFSNFKVDLFNFMPQGGGDPSISHRCPGEGITVEVMKTFLNILISKIDYQVPSQNLSYNLSRIPTLPESGFVMYNIKRR
ncbi:cytochrome P450 [Clostridium paridis]|uniref:Cytochrome P450 n=1 Tax=Clostridium paridis TaxID=2803863 RepID=A0A937K5J1_9CLOT|nr:cytochrome P450 [Clostridium paridis]MBL4933089.1 cytochrome P450 [Clostridium paridis]